MSNSIKKIHLCAWGSRREFHLDVISLDFFPFFYDKYHNFFFFLSTVGLSNLCFGKEEKKRKGGAPPPGGVRSVIVFIIFLAVSRSKSKMIIATTNFNFGNLN